MTSAFTDPRSPGNRPEDRRPPIWAGGRRRRSGIAAGPLWRHTREGAREWVIPRLEWLGARARQGGEAVAAGAGSSAVARLGRAAAVLPPRRHVAGALSGLGRLSLLAAATLAGPPPVEPLPLRPWPGAPGTPAPATTAGSPIFAPTAAAPAAHPVAAPRPLVPETPRRAAPEPMDEAERSILDAIRSAIRAPVAPQRPSRPLPAPPPPPRGAATLPDLCPPEPAVPGHAVRLAAQALALVAHGLALPVGAVLTLRAILRGEGLEA